MKSMQRGFTLIELLVSVAIFAIMMIGVYYFFDSGRWMYLHSQNRANLQENGRLAIEGMEREMRLIGFGIPNGTDVVNNSTMNPPVIYGTISTIGFRGDVDTLNTLVNQPIASGDNTITVPSNLSATYICPPSLQPIPILIVDNGRKYQATNCTGISGSTISISPGVSNSLGAVESKDLELFAPIHVFYRLNPDANADGICDLDTTTAPDYSQCLLQRSEERSLTPLTAPSNNNLWQTYATNVRKLNFTYYRKTDTGPVSLGNNLGTLTYAVDIVRVLITVRDRAAVGSSVIEADRVQQYQSADFTTDVLIRKHRY